jgi:acyl carrier protein
VKETVVAERVRKFLNRQFPLTKGVNDDHPLLQGGLVDSLAILEVVSFLEGEFNISVADEELLPENFGTVHNLAQFVTNKQNGYK